MEGASVLSPSSWEKRRAWARQSRCWRTTVVEEEAAAAMQDVPELQPPHLDDVFLEGSPSSKIETWLQECGSLVEVPPEELGLPGPFGCGSNGTSFEDDLTLGAEALLLPGSDKVTGRTLRDKHLNLGHSMASSALSSLTAKTSSSISEVLEWWQADAEEILYNLGFVQSEPGAVARIPARFFSAPSRAKGIDFQLFLKAQVRRMEMEDPCLTLASRFQQVQALAATADAFFCLYSYVSRTPVQRISPSRLAWACPDIPDIRIAPAQPCTLSPVERLKKAVSTMCLYTSPRDEDSPRGTGRAPTVPTSQPSALGKVVQEVLERAREDRFRFDPDDVLEGWRRDGDTGMAQDRQGAEGGLPEPPSPRLVRGVPACPHHGGADAPARCGGELEPFPRPGPLGTLVGAARGRLERSHPHGRGDGDSPAGARDAPCPAGPGQVGVEDHTSDAAAPWENVTLSPMPGPPGLHAGRVWVTPEHPEVLGSEGDSGFGSGSRGTSPRRKAGSRGCRPRDPLHPGGTRFPGSDTPRAGGHWAERSRGDPPRDAGRQRGDAPGLQPPGKGPSPHRPGWQEPVDSFEMEEVLSTSEDDDDGDAREEAGRSLHPSVGVRRTFMLHASSGQSDSSGFVEEPVPGQPPPARLHGTDQTA
ncbi:protein TESPA1 [Grus americana]|nr:protein TESPA1 [Grus americana]XP_054663315.1 protein TESPA1 [Grus americana]XP_054663316.1 protein TESPA1 [Grus americana]XP_054663317.1 protein TESPA1 [Grus americana]